MVKRNIRRVQEYVIPLLRQRLDPEVNVTSWVPEVDHRDFPIVNIRRLGGYDYKNYNLMDAPVIEMTVFDRRGLVECEDLYMDCLQILYDAVANQTQVEAGYIHSIQETMGMTQLPAYYEDSWRVQGLIRLAVRPPRKRS